MVKRPWSAQLLPFGYLDGFLPLLSQIEVPQLSGSRFQISECGFDARRPLKGEIAISLVIISDSQWQQIPVSARYFAFELSQVSRSSGLLTHNNETVTSCRGVLRHPPGIHFDLSVGVADSNEGLTSFGGHQGDLKDGAGFVVFEVEIDWVYVQADTGRVKEIVENR